MSNGCPLCGSAITAGSLALAHLEAEEELRGVGLLAPDAVHSLCDTLIVRDEAWDVRAAYQVWIRSRLFPAGFQDVTVTGRVEA